MTQTKRKMGMVGCGTPEIMFRERVKARFSKVEGVVGIQVKKDKIILRVVSQEVADRLPKTYYRRPIETQVVGVISKRSAR